MPQQREPKIKLTINPKNKTLMLVFAVVLVIIVVGIILLTPHKERSIASYCKVYKEEKIRLSKLPGETWPSGVFNDSVGDASELVTSFGRLAAVAPDDIRSDVTTLKALYKKVDGDPSSAISASLSGIGPENRVQTWTDMHCNAK
jgi:hypothetical protein